MPAALHATGLVVDVGPHRLLDGVDLALDPGHRLGLVGPNGVGKSTLLRVLAGELAPGRGALHRRPGDATVGLLAQEPARSTTETGRQAVHRRTGVAAADDALHAATADLAAGVAGADDRYSSALDRWTRLGAADLDARLDELADSIGLDGHQLDRPTATLSGGQAARLDLAALLAARFDVLLLDEPTNDLDLAGLDRLERFVSATDAATLIVSHDRAFLRRTIDGVVELDPFTHRLTRYGGGWDGYLTERRVAAEHAQRAYDTYEAKRGALLARAQTEREWATQGLRRARRAPTDNDKNIRAFRINQTEQLAARAARTERAIERLDTVEQPRTAWELRLTFASAPRSGDIVARLEQAGVDRGGFCLGPLDLQITSGERVVIEGANGSGKTTLVGALLGDVELSTGRRFLGPGVRVGRLDQLRDQLDAAPTVLHGVIDAVGASISDARTLLAKFGIATRHVDRPAGTLSPGERTRLVLAVLQARPANLLVLDEPTNHLDLPAIEQLESALDRFPGTIVLVSHDRVLLDAVRRTRTVRLADGQVVADEDGPTPR